MAILQRPPAPSTAAHIYFGSMSYKKRSTDLNGCSQNANPANQGTSANNTTAAIATVNAPSSATIYQRNQPLLHKILFLSRNANLLSVGMDATNNPTATTNTPLQRRSTFDNHIPAASTTTPPFDVSCRRGLIWDSGGVEFILLCMHTFAADEPLLDKKAR